MTEEESIADIWAVRKAIRENDATGALRLFPKIKSVYNDYVGTEAEKHFPVLKEIVTAYMTDQATPIPCCANRERFDDVFIGEVVMSGAWDCFTSACQHACPRCLRLWFAYSTGFYQSDHTCAEIAFRAGAVLPAEWPQKRFAFLATRAWHNTHTLSIYRILLQMGADPNFVDKSGRSLLCLVTTSGFDAAARLLREFGAKR